MCFRLNFLSILRWNRGLFEKHSDGFGNEKKELGKGREEGDTLSKSITVSCPTF